MVVLFLKQVKTNPKPANWRVLDCFFRGAGTKQCIPLGLPAAKASSANPSIPDARQAVVSLPPHFIRGAGN